VRDLIYDVIGRSARSCDMGNLSVNDKIFIENSKKRGEKMHGIEKNFTQISV